MGKTQVRGKHWQNHESLSPSIGELTMSKTAKKLTSLASFLALAFIVSQLCACDLFKPDTVKIGNQVWMTKNLNILPQEGNSWCYDDDPQNCEKYGRLYDWKAALSACPEGWHLPSKDEWDALAEVTGGQNIAGKKLKAKNGWRQPKILNAKSLDNMGSDEYGFSALSGGGRFGPDFENAGVNGYWWSSSEGLASSYAYYRSMYYDNEYLDSRVYSKNYGFSIRCVQD
jgi:uncharacterized protein (TIGR02145 family)